MLTRKKEIKNRLKQHQLVSLFYNVKSIFEELSLIAEIEESSTVMKNLMFRMTK